MSGTSPKAGLRHTARRVPILVLALLLACLGPATTGAEASFSPPRSDVTLKTIDLAEPWGPHTPAVRSYLLDDGQRPLLVRLWYPTDATTGELKPYMHPAVADAWRDTLPAPDGFESKVRGHTLRNAPLSQARRRWPVLLFSHGRSFPVDNYQLCLESLVSRGWVVAAISHPHEEALTVLPDGRRLPFDGPTWQEDGTRGDVLMGVVDDLVDDASRVLDHLDSLARLPSPFHHRLDLAGGVGYFGHSLGGAAAAWALQRDGRVKAAASWEGQVYRAEDRPLRPRGPFLYLLGGANRHELAGHHYRPAPGGGVVFEAVLEGAWHASFGDLLYLYRPYADRDWLQRHRREMTARRANQISSDLLHEFFAYALEGQGLDLLAPDSAGESRQFSARGYPEVDLRVYAGYTP